MAFKAGAVVGKAELDTSNWDRNSKKLGKSSEGMKGKLKGLAKFGFLAVAAAVTAVVAGMAKAIGSANEYQKALANVTTLTNSSAAENQKMSAGLLRMSGELGSATELTKSMYDAISAGAKPGKEALDVVANSAKFAKAAMADNAASVKLLSSTVNAYGKENVNAQQAADVFFTTIKKGVITGEELSGTIGQSIPLFASLNIPVEQLASGMAAMTKQGVSASESTTQLNAIVNSFLKPSATLSEHIRDMGYETGESFIKAEGLTGALDLLKRATNDEGEQLAELVPNIRAMRGAMALSGKGGEAFTNTLADMAKSSGVTDQAFKKQEKTFSTFANTAKSIVIIVGNIGKFFIDQVVPGATRAAEALRKFLLSGKAIEKMGTVFAYVGSVFGVYADFAKIVYNVIKDQLIGVFNELREKFIEIIGPMGNTGIIFTVLTNAAKAYGMAISIVLSIMKIFLKAAFNFVNAATEMGGVISDLWSVLRGKKSIKDVKKSLKEVGGAFKTMGTDVMSDVKDAVSNTIDGFSKMIDGSATTGEDMSENFKNSFDKTKSYMRKHGQEMVTGIKDMGAEMLADTKSSLEKSFDEFALISEKINNKGETISNKFKTFFQNIGQSIATKFPQTTKLVTEQASTIADGFRAMYAQFQETTSMYYEQEQNEREADYQNQKEILDKKLKNGVMTEEKYNKELQKLDEENAKKKNEIAKKQFKAEKAFSMTNIWMNAATAIAGWWASFAKYGPIGMVLAGTMTAATTAMAIAQTAMVAKQKFVPAYAKGTRSADSGVALVGEEGPELVKFRGGESVLNAKQTNDAIMGGMSGGDINININNPSVRNDADIDRIANKVSRVLGRQYAFS